MLKEIMSGCSEDEFAHMPRVWAKIAKELRNRGVDKGMIGYLHQIFSRYAGYRLASQTYRWKIAFCHFKEHV